MTAAKKPAPKRKPPKPKVTPNLSKTAYIKFGTGQNLSYSEFRVEVRKDIEGTIWADVKRDDDDYCDEEFDFTLETLEALVAAVKEMA